MNLIPESASQWWQKRDSREQNILTVFFVFLIGAGIYISILEPIVGGYWEVQSKYEKADSDYRWLQGQMVILNKLKAESGNVLFKSIPIQQLRENIEDELGKLKLSANIDIVNRGDQELVEIEVTNAGGTQLMRWLENLSNKGQNIQALDLENSAGKLSGIILIGG